MLCRRTFWMTGLMLGLMMPPLSAEDAAPAKTDAPVPAAVPAPDAAALPGVTPPPTTPPPTTAPPPPATAAPRRPGLNELSGKFQSRSTDPRSFRITTANGFNVEFTYDKQTMMINGGSPITLEDIAYGDELVVRYAGKELHAIEIDRVKKAAMPY